MIERFILLNKEVKMALLQLDKTFDTSDAEINLLKELCQALSPLKAAIETLGAEKADLLVAKKVFAFVIKKLSQLKTNIGKNLKERFFFRVKERRNHGLVHLF